MLVLFMEQQTDQIAEAMIDNDAFDFVINRFKMLI